MQSTTKIKILNVLIAICCVLILALCVKIYLLSDLHNEIMLPAYHSTHTVCSVQSNEIEDFQQFAQENGFIIQGAYDPSNDEIIVISKDPEEYDRIMRHELCHQKQHEEQRAYGCEGYFFGHEINTELFLFFNEVECYIAEREKGSGEKEVMQNP